MAGDFQFEIGGVGISAYGELPVDNMGSLVDYRPFLSTHRKNEDITLLYHQGCLKFPSAGKVFECPPIWSLYHHLGNTIIDFFPDIPGLRRALVISSEGKRADLYLGEGPHGFVDPFYAPTVELLLVHYLAQGYGVIVHACGIATGDRGILFVGESGAGKSTMARLWAQEKGVDILSDDRVIVRKREDHFWMYGTPWHGDAAFASPRGMKAEKIFFLKHSSRNAATEIIGIDPPARLLTCSFPPYWDPEGMRFTLEFFADLAAKVPCYELSFRPDRSIVEFVQTIVAT
jgi:hypothetical protein